jgi:hypothetical protein
MTSQRELRLSYRELNRVVITCGKCAAEECLDLTNDTQMEKFADNPNVMPLYCGICQTPIHPNLVRAVRCLRDGYIRLKTSGQNIDFRVSVDSTTGELNEVRPTEI